MSIENSKNDCDIGSDKIHNSLGFCCLKKKKISEFSEKDMQNINNIIAGGYKEGVYKIDLIKDQILSTGGFDMENEVMTMVIVSIISYYLNNNFYDKVELFLKELKLVNLDLLVKIINDLILKYKDTNKYCFISNHCQGILFYQNLFQKEKFINDGWLETVNIDAKLKLKNVIDELSNLKNKIGDPYWFNYFNTLVSYTNYELIFVNKEDKLFKNYIDVLLKFISSIDVDLSEYSDIVKTVYVNNLSVLYKLSGNETIKENIDYIKKTYLTKETDGLKTFSKFYGGFDVDGGCDDISYIGLVLEENYISKYSLSYILSELSPVFSVKKITGLFYNYYNKLHKEVFSKKQEEIYLKNNSLQDVIFHDLMDRLENIVGFNYGLIDYFIKVFLIQYLGLNVNEVNIAYKIDINKTLNKRISLEGFNKDNSMNYKSTINLNFQYNGQQIPLSINLNGNIDEKDIKKKIKLYKTKFEVFFKVVIDKLLSLNHFLSVIDDKISIIKEKHPETVKHMTRVGKLMHIIYEEINNTKLKGKIDLLKETLPFSDESFFDILGYLHDIGKYDNLEVIGNYSTINMRTDSYRFFLQFLMSIVDKEEIDEAVDKKSKEKIILDDKGIIEEVEKKYMIIDMINKLFRKVKSFNIGFLLGNNLFMIDILNIATKISEVIKNNGYSIDIINNNSKNKILKNIKQKFGKFIDYDGNIDDLFLGVIIVFEMFNKKLLKEITHPHIEYGLQFFRFFPEFSYLSSVLYHHKDYPSIETINKYDGFVGLDKFSKLIGEKNEYSAEGKDYISLDKKDVIMVMTTVADIMDALLGKRNYQLNININETNSGKYLSPGFINYLNKVFSGEDLSDKNKTFDKILGKLGKELGNNPYYLEIKSILEKKRSEIIAMYKK